MFTKLLNELKQNAAKSIHQDRGAYTWIGSDLSPQNLPHCSITNKMMPHLPDGHEVKQAILNLNDFASDIKGLLSDQISVIADDEASIRINGLTEQQIRVIEQQYLRRLDHLLAVMEKFNWLEQPDIVRNQFQNYLNELLEISCNLASYHVVNGDDNLPSKEISAAPCEVDPKKIADIEFVRSQLQNKTYADDGLPWPVIDYPHSRDWLDYNRLHFAKLSRARNQRLLAAHLEQNNEFAIVVDSGMGDGHALTSYKKDNNFTIGFSLQDLPEHNKNHIDVCCFSPVPNGEHARWLFDILRGRVTRVIETYGAVTYDKNPFQAAVYLGLLLRPEGEAEIIFSEIKGDIDQSPLGFSANREALVVFFKEELGLDAVIRRTTINSAVNPGEVCYDFHLHMKRSRDASVCEKPLDEIFQMIEQRFGVCSVVPKKSDFGNFSHGFSIVGSTYTLPGAMPQQESLLQSDGIVGVHWKVNQKSTGMRVELGLAFKDNEVLNTFVNLFHEMYVRHYNSDWNLRVDHETLSVRLDYYDKEMEQNDIQRRFGGTPGFFNKRPWQALLHEGENLELCVEQHKAHEIANCIVKAINQIAVLVPSSERSFALKALEGSIAPLSAQVLERLNLDSEQADEPSHLNTRFQNQYLSVPALN
ncbi:hypothetical protein [Legionella bononiensis]|uniref:Uncharacterized protein n=1 Tax=Legionella bononiensis TaxID=2793102 RepID=A0ABS1WBU0_9GAMM|nr:hypothetical protein [Legionella bononiensis]MBL7481104.1 hypothetical protein [Legionella bononiensis]MBL7526813.1 hypothetical protein [Legionella bononiensis]MBL7564220.1 hypothetical protein [Legionella bononiensis]